MSVTSGVTTDAAPGGPDAESRPNGSAPSLEGRVQSLLDELLSRPTRDPKTGQFAVGALGGAAGTLARSRLLLDALAPVKRDLVAKVLADRGLDAGAAETMLGFVDAYCEARLLRQSMWIRLIEQGGPITGKGRKRAVFTAYLSALDRETKLAAEIGLERQSRPIVNGVDYLKQL